jgi:hypothetical protein
MRRTQMNGRIFVLACLIGLLVAPSVASAARWSRGECTNAANERYGKVGQSHQEMRAAIERCMRHGPGAL